MKNHIVIKTHHKTGTSWMNRTFRGLPEEINVNYVHLSRVGNIGECHRVLNDVSDDMMTIFFHPYGTMPKINETLRHRFRGLHVIRDPRDLILSSARYHTWAKEAWLHKAQDRFDGKTYQEALNALSGLSEQVEFEMKYSARDNINEMVNFDRQDVFFDMKYEHMRSDMDLILWHRTLLRLGFEAQELAPAMRCFVNNSIQFGTVDMERPHIQDTSISPWLRAFPEEKLDMFDALFTDHIKALKYPTTRRLRWHVRGSQS